MKTPSFRFMGGKARLRNWLLEHFPQSGESYYEPFVGNGNVYFAARTKLNFKHWRISDLNIDFLGAFLIVNIEDLPDEVTREDFEKWKCIPETQYTEYFISKIIEPRITFAGKGYASGYSGSSGTHSGYNGKLYRETCLEAQRLIGLADLKEFKWSDVLYMTNFHVEDFIYLDPPYYNTKTPYPNINHEELLECLNNLNCRWAISGYDSELYQNKLQFKNKYQKVRNSEIKSSNSGHYETSTETLWTNY